MGGASGRWLSPDGAAFTNGIRALKKETLESSGLGPSAVGVICAPGSGPFPDAESVDTLGLDIPVSRTVRKKVLFISYLSVWWCVTAAQTDQDTKPKGNHSTTRAVRS